MANLAETSTWEPGIYQLEEEDLVQGGPDGIDNTQAKQLANRTQYLKQLIETISGVKQDADGTLAAIAALVGIADRMIYFTGNDQAALTVLTAFARTLLDDADAATMRATLGAAPLASPALSGTPTAPTPTQFDASQALATMEAVQRALGSFSGAVSYDSAAVALTSADIGKAVVVSVASTVTLPPAASVILGAVLYISATGTGNVTLVRSGADSIIRNDGVSVSSLVVKSGTSIVLRQGIGGTAWYVVNGDAALQFSSVFGASLGSSGYQKLPSGLIVQWGPTGAVSSSGGPVTVTFPIAFPTACRAIAFGPNATQAVMVSAESIAAANFAYSAFAPGGGRLASIGSWFISIGN